MKLHVLTVLLLASFQLPAATITLSATDSGWYATSTTQNQTNSNYTAGRLTSGEFRSFFIFSLPSLNATITGATLRAYNPSLSLGNDGNGFSSTDPTETMALWDVSTSSADLLTRTNAGAFADLGGGTQFGSRTVSSTDNGTVVEFILNSAGISAIQLGLGQTFSIGGSLTTIVGSTTQQMFGFTGSPSASTTPQRRELVLTYEESSAVPEPSTWALTAAAGLWLTFRASFRRK